MILSSSVLRFFYFLPCLMMAADGMGVELPPLSELIRAADDQPIRCHIRFLDQDGQVVPNVPVRAHIWTYNPDRSTANTKELVGLTTDASGLVAIENEHGSALRLMVDSDKYTHGFYDQRVHPGVVLRFSTVGGNGSLRYGTVKEPAEYLVWRKEGPQSLISLSGDLRIDYSSGEKYVDLATGRLVDQGGDLVIKIEAAENEGERRKSADHRGYFPYSATVTVNEGALAPM